LENPPAPEYELYLPNGLRYDSGGNLWILWTWDYFVNGLPVAYYLSLSKSTDEGESFSEILREDRGLWIENERLFVDESDNVHILRDAVTPEPSVVYTKLIAGNPTTRIDTFLPQPVGPSGLTFTDDVDFWIDGDSLVHYASEVQRHNGIEWESQIEYSRSLDGGLTFSQLVSIDTTVPPFQLDPRMIRTNSGLLLLTYELADFVLQDYWLLAVVSEDDGSSFGSPFEFGTYPSGQIGRLARDSIGTYVFYSTPDTVYGMVYERYDDPRNPPNEVASFDSLLGDLALGVKGEKYAVMRTTPFAAIELPYLFFSSKDIPTSVDYAGQSMPLTIALRAAPNPFNSTTTLFVDLPIPGIVSVEVFDIQGRRVYAESIQAPGGRQKVMFNAERLASGVYIARASVAGYVNSTKLLLLK
jgi:hypothetical protein